METKLIAILVGDIVDYRRLTSAHETETMDGLPATFEFVRECVADHGGRVFDTGEHSLLCEFGSVVDAVSCALEVLEIFEELNAEISPDRRLLLRLGIHLGDVDIDGDTYLGDAVSIATHLATPDEPDGLFISEGVYQNVADKIDIDAYDMGEHELKGIAWPIRAYRISTMAAMASARN